MNRKCAALLLALASTSVGCASATRPPGPSSEPRSLDPTPRATVPTADARSVGATPSQEAGAPSASSLCPEGMVYVEGGAFKMGMDPAPRGQPPAHAVTVQSFCIDRTEVTVRAYRACVADRSCVAPSAEVFGCTYALPSAADLPIACISAEAAEAYCLFAGRRLPTEAEWEFAARGVEGRPFVWGDAKPTDEPCWSAGPEGSRQWKGPCPVGTHPKDVSWCGAMDMSGGVGEWTSSACSDGGGPSRVERGGSWLSNLPSEGIRPSSGMCRHVDESPTQTGVRCASSVLRHP